LPKPRRMDGGITVLAYPACTRRQLLANAAIAASRVARRMAGQIFRLVNGETSGRRRLVFPDMGVA
jgi:hypothetical protein